jgi:DNA topoisomerase IB
VQILHFSKHLPFVQEVLEAVSQSFNYTRKITQGLYIEKTVLLRVRNGQAGRSKD